MVLYSGGRNANSEGLGCENVNVKLGVRGRINVKGASFQTSNPLVHAIGDVIGPPGLASSAMMQAKAVAESVFGNEGGRKGLLKGNVPLTIWTMPEIAICGLTAEKAIALRSGSGSRGRIVTGYAYFKDIARGRLVDPEGERAESSAPPLYEPFSFRGTVFSPSCCFIVPRTLLILYL